MLALCMNAQVLSRLRVDLAGEARLCIAGTQTSQSDDSSAHFGVMPVLTDRESRFRMSSLDRSLRQG